MRKLSILTALLLGAAAGCSSTADQPMTPTAPAPVTTVPAAPPETPPVPEAPASARYRVVFDAIWTASTHPRDAPPNPHFSPLIGATHNGTVAFWRDGALATEGIRRMAELGSTTPLDNEIRAAIAAGTAERLILGIGLSSPKSVSLEFDISRDYPLVTLVTMVAPSPDWFAGVSGLSLFANGAWVDERTLPVLPWDAGTDSGVSFVSPDRESVPREPIARITTPPLAVGGVVAPLGTLTFTRLTPPGIR